MSVDKNGIIAWLRSWFDDLYVQKVTGKGLSTNDYTSAEKNKLANIEAQANKTVVDSSMSSTSTNPVQNKVIWDKCVLQDDYELDTVSDNIPLRISQVSGQYLSGMGFTNDDTIEEVLEEFAGRIVEMQRQWNTVYPVGAIYMSVNNTSPSTLFGGTWQRLEDTFLYATSGTADTGYQATGGEATHTLSINEMPSHTHIQNAHSHQVPDIFSGGTGSESRIIKTSGRKGGYQPSTEQRTPINQNTGGGQAHNNMPPYMNVYMWKRTA